MKRPSSLIGLLKCKIMGLKHGKRFRVVGSPSIFVTGKGEIRCGDNVIINSSFSSNYVGLYQKSILMARNGGKILVGNNVGMSGITIYSRSKISIGDNTLIGANVKILDNDFHPSDPEIRLRTPNNNFKIKPIEIGNNVFIGCNSIILKGCKIGDNVTIGAGSVLTGGVFPSNSLVCGNPARVIRGLSDEGCGDK